VKGLNKWLSAYGKVNTTGVYVAILVGNGILPGIVIDEGATKISGETGFGPQA
jgi:hypothetical protein